MRVSHTFAPTLPFHLPICSPTITFPFAPTTTPSSSAPSSLQHIMPTFTLVISSFPLSHSPLFSYIFLFSSELFSPIILFSPLFSLTFLFPYCIVFSRFLYIFSLFSPIFLFIFPLFSPIFLFLSPFPTWVWSCSWCRNSGTPRQPVCKKALSQFLYFGIFVISLQTSTVTIFVFLLSFCKGALSQFLYFCIKNFATNVQKNTVTV